MKELPDKKPPSPKENAHVPVAAGTQADKMAYKSNLEKPISTISPHKKQIMCRLGERYFVRLELASVILDNCKIGGQL
mgnify:CR=1 FL=1